MVGLSIGTMSLIGFRNTGSPTLFRLSIAFFSISSGFFVIWMGYLVDELIIKSGDIERWVQTLGIAIQTIGYFFIAFSHSIKSFFPKTSYFRSIVILPLFVVSTIQLEHLFRSISFILLAYGAIETLLSHIDNRNKGAILVAAGLGLLALGEFLGWYAFVFPELVLDSVSIMIKIIGLILLFIPVSRVPLMKIKFDEDFDKQD